MPNPYTLVFGQPPLEFVERAPQAERITSEFCSERPFNYINLVTGIRGSGKTVFITEIANRLNKLSEWIVVNLNPQRDILKSFASKLNSDKGLRVLFRDAKINLEFLGIGVGIENALPITDIEEALFEMLRAVRKQGKRILVTIDEATNSKDMRIFASSYQIMIREELPVFLLMTGLNKDIDYLKNADGMTFLERAPRTVLGPLNLDIMTDRYIERLNLGQDKATELAVMTKGYPFAFQTIGYFSWENPKNKDKAVSDAREYLYEFAYNKIWSELSKNEREVVAAVAKAETSKVCDVREVLGYSTNQFNPYRDRLIKAGVLISNTLGHIDIALPFFDEYAVSRSRAGRA